MKTYTRPSRRTLRAHHLVKLGLILTLIVCVLISRRESPGNNSTKAQAGSPRTAAERMASFRGKVCFIAPSIRMRSGRKTGMPSGVV
jgi:hypothetical protein